NPAVRRHFWGLLCLSLVLTMGTYYWSPLLRAKWSITDDHQIFSFIGQAYRLPVADIPQVLIRKTELGDIGSGTRFRPTYYFLRVLETSVLGKNPSAWYIVEISVWFVFSTMLTIVLLRIADPGLVLAFLAYELSRPYWSDIFARLG